MKTAERIAMSTIILVIIAGVVFVYYSMRANHRAVLDGVARGEYEIRPEPNAQATTTPPTEEKDWRSVYPRTVPITIGTVVVEASVADTVPERIQGLSGTPYLPPTVVKLFDFGAAGTHAIWMKDMNYPIDILWLSQTGSIVHIEENISPDTFPESFGSPTPTWYVIETVAGFVDTHKISIGDQVVLPTSTEPSN